MDLVVNYMYSKGFFGFFSCITRCTDTGHIKTERKGTLYIVVVANVRVLPVVMTLAITSRTVRHNLTEGGPNMPASKR